jgi:hypothetical protein
LEGRLNFYFRDFVCLIVYLYYTQLEQYSRLEDANFKLGE